MKHTHKVQLARRMRTQKEIRNHVSIWDTKAWLTRRESRTGIKGGRNRPLPLNIRRILGRNSGELPKQQKKESFVSRARNFIKGNKATLPQKVV